MRGKAFIISGPSGVGKSTVLKTLFKKRGNLYFSVSATTRAPRAGEVDGVAYRFLSPETFREWVEQDQFLEYAEFVDNSYGTPRKYVFEAMEAGQDVILDIEVQGATQVKEKMPDVVRIYLAPPSWEELERRLRARGTDGEETIQKRLRRAKEEFALAHTYDYFVINDTVEQAATELDCILTAAHCRLADRMYMLAE